MAVVVFLDAYTNNPGDLDFGPLNALGDVSLYERTPTDLLVDRASEAEILIVNKFVIDADAIQSLPKLRYIIVAATGYNNVDIAACAAKGIQVSNIRGYSTEAVTQHVFSLILALHNRVAYYDQEIKKGRWSRSQDFCFYDHGITHLNGKTLGLIGWGTIAKRVAAIGLAFGMKVAVFSRTMTADLPDGIRWMDKEAIFKSADVLSLHCPLTEDTKAMINKQTLAKMKPTAFLINTGRGGLVNESDLFYALDHNLIAGAGLDVMTQEPPHITNPLLYHSLAVITPHLAWASIPARASLLQSICDYISSYYDGKVINSVL
jgi:glycerate dehydrogenase